VLGNATDPASPAFKAVDAVFAKNVAELTAHGATVVDPIVIPNLKKLPALQDGQQLHRGDQHVSGVAATITVPSGFTEGGLPAGITFLGPAYTEPTLLTLAYAYEQATRHRVPPGTTPPLATTPSK
jgi:amidase